MSKRGRVKRIVLFILVFVPLLGAGASWWWVRASLPPLDGELGMPGLRAPVEVVFDRHGVPHVYAAGAEDAWFAAGVMHARDRLWQMELYRRAAAGRLSEILGEQTLPIDRRLLTLDLRNAAEAEWQGMAPTARAALLRYAAGVNAELGRQTGRFRTPELQLLGVTPAEWTPVDSLAVGRLLAWRLAENHQAELVRHALAYRFGAAEALRLGGRYPANAPAIVPGPAAAEDETEVLPDSDSSSSGDTDRLPGPPAPTTMARAELAWPPGLEWLQPMARRGGSNNWVLAGARTTSGRPLLANDPHLQLEFPGVWYEMHLVAADLDVIGVTIPGTPFVVIGHNKRVAWGLTNTGADVQDLFIDRVDLPRRRYYFQGQWHPVDVVPTEIAVRGGEARRFEIWRTRQGTVFADVGLDVDEPPAWLSPDAERKGERRVFSLRWDTRGETAGAFEALNRAASWTEFTAAVARFSLPSQNFVYADVDGNIGYAMSGVLPQRAGSTGALPVDGTTGEGDWVGRVSPADLPRAFNPPRGYLASANNLVDRGWRGIITRDWTAPFRATRLGQLIEGAERVSVEAAAAWQNDVTSLAAEAVLASSERALTMARDQENTVAVNVLSELRAWDRKMDGRPIVTLYQRFEAAMWQRTFADEMGEMLFAHFYDWAGAERPAGLYALLGDPTAHWFDDIATIDRRETRDDMVVLAAEDAGHRHADGLEGQAGWSTSHQAAFLHALGGASAPLGWLLNRGPVGVPGDIYTLNRTSYRRARPFEVWEVPSWRQIFDVGQWDEAQVVLPGGQSGHPLSPHYFDQNALWRAGQYRTQPYSRSAVDGARAHRLLLTP